MPKKRYEPLSILTKDIQPLAKELVLRCGSIRQAGEYAGLNDHTISNLMNGTFRTCRNHTARLIILAVHQRRKEDRRNGASKRFIDAKRHQAQQEERLMRLEGY